MGSLREDIAAAADWIALALTTSGYPADFSPDSLASVDRFFDDHARDGQPVPGGLLATDLGSRLFALGAYVGEVLCRHAGGTWRTDDDDPRGEVNIAVALPGAGVVWPVQRVMKRLENGREDGIAHYGAALGLAIDPALLWPPEQEPQQEAQPGVPGPEAQPTKSSFFRRWREGR